MRKKDSARFTIDIPNEKHKRLKLLSMIKKQSIRAILEEHIDSQIKKYENEINSIGILDKPSNTL